MLSQIVVVKIKLVSAWAGRKKRIDPLVHLVQILKPLFRRRAAVLRRRQLLFIVNAILVQMIIKTCGKILNDCLRKHTLQLRRAHRQRTAGNIANVNAVSNADVVIRIDQLGGFVLNQFNAERMVICH